jgi:hypothetical protein
MILVAAEPSGRKVFTVDRKDFDAYRVRRGHRRYGLEIVPGTRINVGLTSLRQGFGGPP